MRKIIMRKIINPCKCDVGYKHEKLVNTFYKIEYINGKLSICGVVGPTKNGDCISLKERGGTEKKMIHIILQEEFRIILP